MGLLFITAGSMFLLCLIIRLCVMSLAQQTALNVIGASTLILILGVLALLMFTSLGDYTVPLGVGLSGIAYGLVAYYLLSRVFRKEPSMFELAGLKRRKSFAHH